MYMRCLLKLKCVRNKLRFLRRKNIKKRFMDHHKHSFRSSSCSDLFSCFFMIKTFCVCQEKLLLLWCLSVILIEVFVIDKCGQFLFVTKTLFFSFSLHICRWQALHLFFFFFQPTTPDTRISQNIVCAPYLFI